MFNLEDYEFKAAPEPAFELTKQKKQIDLFKDEFALSYSKISYRLLRDWELSNYIGKILLFDVESYPNYFCIGFKIFGEDLYIRWTTQQSPNKLLWILTNFVIVGFNSYTYDLVMSLAAMKGIDDQELFNIGVAIIGQELTQVQGLKVAGVKDTPVIDHIDLFEVAPLEGSLKLYAGRLHTKRMQELPYEVGQYLSEDEIEQVNDYNINDLNNTELLFFELMQDLRLRTELSEIYKVDLRSKSDAQIAETIIKKEYKKLTNKTIERPPVRAGQTYYYKAPKFICFFYQGTQDAFELIKKTPLVVSEDGNITLPDEIANLEIKIGEGIYRIGIGGLHSSEKSVSHQSDQTYTIYDRDVASYYPAIMLNNRYFPSHLGLEFLTIYQTLVDRRLEAKKTKNKSVADGLKIAINGTFGKLANKYSCLYSPELLLQVTITGQLSLLMLIEMLEYNHIQVISANTDGVTSLVKNGNQRGWFLDLVKKWEEITKFTTEETVYSALYSRDVNNYIAFKDDGTVKVKGAYSERGSARDSKLSRNPEAQICNDAVIKYIQEGIALEDTITSCKDIRRFVIVRNVRGGAIKSDKYLGKTVRWYMSTEMHGIIEYKTSGNKVPNSEGARPLMELPNTLLPIDIDYKWYIDRANTMLIELSAY